MSAADTLSERLASLTPEQRALFERLRAKERPAARSRRPQPIPPATGATGEGDWPLSLDQERFWFMEQLHSSQAGLNITAASRMRGPVAVPFVATALREIVRRHAAWRTAFPVDDDGRPVQRVAAPARGARAQGLALVDLAAVPAVRRESEAARLVGEGTAAPFDLERGPLVRAMLVRMSAEDHVCLLTVHHLVTDWMSFQVAWAELAALYELQAAGRAPALPPPAVQYADFALWQRRRLEGEVLDELVSWWRERLAGVPTALELPTDRPRPAVARLRGGRASFVVPRELTDGLRALGRAEGATVFMTVLAGIAALLCRDSGQETLILGANNANRNRPEIEPVLGCFLTQVPFVIELAGDPGFREVLARVRRSALGAYAHQDLPFGKLVEALALERDPSRAPLIQTLVQVLEGQLSKARVAGVDFEPVDAWDGRARYDLMLSLFDGPEGLAGALEYDADLFDETTTLRRIERYLLQAAAAVAEPEIPLSALPVLAAAERHQAAVEWNDCREPLPDWTAPERFARQAARTPAAVAVIAVADASGAGEELTYGELDRRAEDLARRLRSLGVGPESRVALLLASGVDVPVAILGVWKAGGAYLPLDRESPAERLADLLAAAEPLAVIHRGPLPVTLAAGVRSLDLAAPPAELDASPLPEIRPGQLAYLIYTSGTTGRPKAVTVEHGSLAAVVGPIVDRYGLGPGDRLPHLARDTFDASFLDLMGPLLTGAAVEILSRDAILDPASLLAALERSTALFIVPALLRRLAAGARERGPARFARLRVIGVGADVVGPELQRDLLAAFPATTLDIFYGPTETTIICTAHRVPRTRRPERTLIGRPLPNVELRVVDARGAPVALGVPGELWIGGPGVARGYFRRDELTAERFVVAGGRRYYRTGDLVRQVPGEGGALEFLGRTDLQVKIRGFRIEPGEVEAALLAHPAVREAVVVADSGPGAESRLVAYVVAQDGHPPPADGELRAALRALLPEHMVPAVFVPLAALPLNSSGKVDRKALPAPLPGRDPHAPSTPPRDAREELLAEIWRGVLGLERVGVHDNFFQLGGDSILSIQVVARARRAGLLVTPQQLFENQTIAGLAGIAGTAAAGVDVAGTAADAEPGAVAGEAPLTPIQRRFFAEERREPWRFNQAVLLAAGALRRIHRAALAAALARLADHHDAVRLRFAREEGAWRQVHAPGEAADSAPLFEIDLGGLPPPARRPALEAAAERLQSGLDLARGPLVTAALFRLGGEGDRLLLTVHHLIVDGVSWRVLLEDLAAVYGPLAAGAARDRTALPAKTTSWKRWAERLADHARSLELAVELPYWLALPRSVARLPADLDAATAATTATAARASVAVELGRAETRALLKQVPEVYRTQVNDLLLAALARAFAGWLGGSGERALLVDLEGHGREEIFPGVDLSRTLGWFTTLFPVALELPPGAGPREAILAVKERLRAVPRRGLGYGLLRYLAGRETAGRLAALPSPEVSFNYLGQVDQTFDPGGPFAPAPEAVRGTEGEPVADDHALSIDALVLDERLRVTWSYDPERHLRATVERLASAFLAEIAALVAHCLSPGAGGASPSDFPLAGLDQPGLDRLLGGAADAGRGVEDLYPLAPLQQGILFHSLYTAGSELYVEQLAAELHGPLDEAAFAGAWRRVVERHAALRTAFVWEGLASPLQLVRRAAELPWTVEDWRAEPASSLASRWAALAAADRARGFDLGRPPLTRLALVRTGESSHRLLWSFHHLIFDGWCFSLLLGEVFTLYAAAREHREPLLPPAPRPYRDYLAWLAGRDAAEAERAWRQVLRGFEAPTPLPFDHPAGAGLGSQAADYHERTVSLLAPRVARLEALARRLQVTLNTLVQAAWALLLSRYAGTADVVFGAVVSGRPAELPGVESMVGLFINTVPVRVAVPAEEPAAAWLVRLQASQWELRRHEWTPLARVQALAEVPAGEPLFHSLLAFENYPVDPAVAERLGDLAIGEVSVTERTNYPLTLTAVARGDLALRLTADRRFDPSTVRRILSHLENLLDGLAADPVRPPRALPLLGEAERHQLVVEWNPGPASAPLACPLHERFAAWARQRPAAVAVCAGEASLTYCELERRANRLACHLAAAGVRGGDLVALCLERTLDIPLAILAVLKAGAAYLPLDPAYPAARLAWMLEDSGVEVLVTRGDLASALPPAAARRRTVIRLDADAGAIARRDAVPPAAVTPEQAIYVIYTSGSTGQPKGVVVTHANVDRLLAATAPWFGFGRDDVWTLFHSYAFDFSVWELWGALALGGRLVVVPYTVSRSPEELLRLLAEERVTVLNQTPSAFRQLSWAEEMAGTADLALRTVVFGGEALELASLAPWFARHGDERPRLVNMYGITETTVHVTYRPLAAVDLARGSVVGQPLPDLAVHVLDGDLEPLPVGVAGELFVAGEGLVTGYLGRPELTAERFLPDPYGAAGGLGARLYRSGDLARRLPDGDIEYLGRTDQQVKIRGFRIELGEIEANLAAHPAVREAVVVVGTGERAGRLIAYATLREGVDAAADQLREFLAERLPAYMVPGDLVRLAALPLTVNGKVDRAALPQPAAETGTMQAPLVVPATPAEEVLLGVWRQVLGRERIAIHDDFFRLGGDSILSIQVVARARQGGWVITPRQLFEQPTIAALAAVATPLAAAESEQGAVEGDVPLTPIQRYFLDARPADPHHFNQSLLLAVREPLAAPPLARALAALAAHHDALRLRFVREDDGSWRAWNAPAETGAPLVIVDLSALAGERGPGALGALEAAAAALQGAFDLGRGPLFRAARFVLGEGERLLLIAHHLVVDGVSWRVLLDDLETAYDQELAGRPIELPPKTTSWKRWAERLAEHARSGAVRAELSNWLAGADTAPLPSRTGPAGEPAGPALASASTVLGREATRALLGEAPAAYRARVDDLLLAGLARAFARWTEPITGSTRLRLDLEGHGREEIEPGLDLSRTVGWFTTIFPLVLDAPLESSDRDLLRAVKETIRAVPRRGIGYGLLRYLGGTDAEAARLAAIQSPEVAFNYLGQLDGALGGGARWSLAPEPAGPDQSPRAGLRHPLEVNAWVLDGELRVSFTFAVARFAPETIEALARGYVAALAELVEHCMGAEAGGLTPSDVPLAGLDQATLDGVIGRDGAAGAGLDRTIEDLYPLAPLQQGMLFHGLYAPRSELYFEHLTADLAGPLDAAAFARAWQGAVDRHPVLRTGFAWEGLPRPLQVVRRGVELPWTSEDWRQVPRDEVPRRLAAWLAADRARPFDLARAPLLRGALLRTGEEEHRFVWSFHHLLIDGWCFSLIFRDVFALYQAAVAGREARLPAVRPYRDFIGWVARQDGSAAEAYFRQALAGFAEPTRLPLDRPDLGLLPAAGDGGPRDEELRLATPLVAALSALAQARGMTLNTLVQGAWGLLLARFGGPALGPGGVADVVFGTVVSGRPAELPGVESMVGLFINTLPVRVTVDPAAPLDAWLATLQARLLELRQHETAALAEIQRASDVAPGEPLFQSLVAFENYPVDESLGAGAEELTVREITVTDRTDYPLSLAVLPGAGRRELALRLAHDRRTDATTVRRLLAHLELLLGAFAAADRVHATLLRDLPTVNDTERHQILLEWSGLFLESDAEPDTEPDAEPDAEADAETLAQQAADPPAGFALHALVAAQARREPAAIALVADGREMTYGELDRRASRLAHRLRARGVGPEDLVALAVERSLEMVVAVLGILKAGGAYLPIDPETPADRLAFVLADARPALLLTSEALAGRLRSTVPVPPTPIVTLDVEDDAAASPSGDPPALALDLASLAYVIYTSGSTGQPKGVGVTHRSAAAYARIIARTYAIGPGDRELQFAPLPFDASVEEIFAPLAAGATVVLRSGPAEEPARFLAACAEQGITILSLPTAYWHQIAAALETEDLPLPPRLRFIVAGGERTLPERWSSWSRGAGRSVRLVNAYGPTEATVAATWHEHPRVADPLAGRREVPIGRPLAGARAYVVDGDLRPVPAGAAGELLLGGVGLARGYLGRPELTAERFVPDPFADRGARSQSDAGLGARLYRTGDLVRFLPDGKLEFVGRLDTQVKVRGFRIELGEVEAALAAHLDVREAAAGTREDASGNLRLIAYVVPRSRSGESGAPDQATLDAAIRDSLSARLPAYMVPSRIVFLSALPLTASDKLDRRALAWLGPEPERESTAFRPPRNPIEEAIAAIWSALLGVERVGLDDDFLALGGHSLLITQLASRLRRELGVDLPLSRLFALRRLEDLAGEVLAQTLDQGAGAQVDDLLAELDGLSDEEALALLAAEEESGEPPAQP